MVQVSQAAVQEIIRLGSRQNLPAPLQFRLSTIPKGCLSRSYKMEFIQHCDSGDQVLAAHSGISVIVNSSDQKYVDGLVIDYSEDLMGGGFRFHNPNASQVCSCGHSFSVSVNDDTVNT